MKDKGKGAVERRLRFDSMQRLDQSRTEHICGRERQLDQSIFRASLHSRPHASSSFRSVSALTGNIDKGHRRIQSAENFCRRKSNAIGDPPILLFFHSAGRHAEAEKAGVEAGEACLYRVIVE